MRVFLQTSMPTSYYSVIFFLVTEAPTKSTPTTTSEISCKIMVAKIIVNCACPAYFAQPRACWNVNCSINHTCVKVPAFNILCISHLVK
uniref:Uncharacterized protein n=1 Tax=Anguilla anguilla TaxID=7936 RepID=A0A0E9SN35_ANGAN